MNPQDIVLSQYPRPLTIGDVEQLLNEQTGEARDTLAEVILHRLRGRYITPLENISPKYRSGFLIMASCCLLIETFQCFKQGKEDTTGRGEGKAAFVRFFQDHPASFPYIGGSDFYLNVRCGILHQAQTKGCFRIVRKKGAVLFDAATKTINADAFLLSVRSVVEDYVSNLKATEMNHGDWPNALKKLRHICDTSKK